MTVKRRPPAQPGDEHLKALGRIAANFSLLEVALTFIVWRLIASDAAITITDGMSFRRLVNLFRRLADHRTKDAHARKQIRAWCKRAEKAAERRNDMLHSMWTFDNTGLGMPGTSAVRGNLRGT